MGASFEVRPFGRERHDVVDALEVGVRRHMVHALLELDVTAARALIHERGAIEGEPRIVPGFLRRAFFRVLRRQPHWLKRTAGTTLVTAVGMFGMGRGWVVGIVPLHTLALTVCGITRKPGVVDGRVEVREYLALTASVDHDVVDGAPAARFARRLREIVEGAEVLREDARPGGGGGGGEGDARGRGGEGAITTPTAAPSAARGPRRPGRAGAILSPAGAGACIAGAPRSR